MKKLLITLLATVLSGVLAPVANATTNTVNCSIYGNFTITDNQVTENNACQGSAVIPDGVTAIMDNAFQDAIFLTSVTIPSGVTSIGNYAFWGATDLTSVSIPNSVTSLGMGVFQNATLLSSVTLSNQITTIPQGTFYNATSLNSITIPNSVISIGISAFENAGLTSITIPNSVTSIGAGAFQSTRSVTSISIGTNVRTIGEYAFAYNVELTSISFPASVTSIDELALINCNKLETINVRGENANYSAIDGVLYDLDQHSLIKFPEAKDATGWTIPTTVTYIGYEAMAGISGITDLVIPDGVTTIAGYAFNRAKFTTITIPSTVIFLETNFLYNNTFLTTIIVSPANINYSSLDGVLFNKLQSTLIKFPQSKNTNVSPYVVPLSVVTLEWSAFQALRHLISISLSNRLTTIEPYAFSYGNSSFITIPDSITQIPQSAFRFNGGLVSVTLPLGLTSIGPDAFEYTTALRRVCYTGNNAGVIASIIAAGKVVSCTPVTVPGVPVIGTATSTGRYSAILTFDAPADDGGTRILSYTATATDVTTNETFTNYRYGTSTDPFVFDFLVPGATYTFTITAANILGDSVASAVSNEITTDRETELGLASTFSTPSYYDFSFTVQVTNFDAAYTYSVSSSAGRATINSKGLVTVTGLSPDQSATVTVTTTRDGYDTGTASTSGRSQVAPMRPGNKPVITITPTAITCTIGSYSAEPTSAIFSLFVDGTHISTIFSALGDYLPDWIIGWATPATITRTGTLTSATWAFSDSYKGKAITCTTVAYSHNATGSTASEIAMIN